MKALPPVRPEYVDMVARMLPATDGRAPREINAALPDLTRNTVYTALLVLVRTGRATFHGDMNQRRYRRVELA